MTTEPRKKPMPPDLLDLEHTMYESAIKHGIWVLNSIMMDEDTGWYSETINKDYFQTQHLFDQYLEAIHPNEPIDFSQIAGWVESQQYTKSQDIFDHIETVLENAMKFNKPDTDWYKSAKRLQKIYKCLRNKKSITKSIKFKPCYSDSKICPYCRNILLPLKYLKKASLQCSGNCGNKITGKVYCCYNHQNKKYLCHNDVKQPRFFCDIQECGKWHDKDEVCQLRLSHNKKTVSLTRPKKRTANRKRRFNDNNNNNTINPSKKRKTKKTVPHQTLEYRMLVINFIKTQPFYSNDLKRFVQNSEKELCKNLSKDIYITGICEFITNQNLKYYKNNNKYNQKYTKIFNDLPFCINETRKSLLKFIDNNNNNNDLLNNDNNNNKNDKALKEHELESKDKNCETKNKNNNNKNDNSNAHKNSMFSLYDDDNIIEEKKNNNNNNNNNRNIPNLAKWNVNDVRNWLKSIGFGSDIQKHFVDNCVDGSALIAAKPDELEQFLSAFDKRWGIKINLKANIEKLIKQQTSNMGKKIKKCKMKREYITID